MVAMHDTREGWLKGAMGILGERYFKANGYELPEKLAVSCGFPRSSSGKAIGQCFDPKCSKDETTHMFVCPTRDEPVEVLGILLHEMIHASVGIEAGHKGPFRKLAKEFGLEGKMTATVVAEGTDLHAQMLRIAGELGTYPHAAMQPVKRARKPGGGWLRYRSATEEDYKILISPKQLEEHGPPRDPWGDEMEPVE